MPVLRRIAKAGLAGGAAWLGYVALVEGKLAPSLNIGRRAQSLGPLTRYVDAPRDAVFDVVADPYLGRTPAAMRDKLNVLERSGDMVLAEHFTDAGLGLTATTVETVRFERPHTIHFRLVRGPVASVTETFEFTESNGGTEFNYSGELATDLWKPGELWGRRVAGVWVRTVEESMTRISEEAERRERAARQN